jgi:hypothetical protein
MTGLPAVRLLGTPKYTHFCNSTRLCVPKVLADHLFHGPVSSLGIDQMFASNPMESTDHPIKTTRGVLESGRIWRMDFTEVAMRYEPPGSRGSPLQMLDPHYNFLDTLSPEQKCYYLPCATLGSRNH